MTVQAGGAVLVLAAAVLGLWRYGVQRRQRRTLVWALAAAIGEMESAIRWQQTPMMALLEGLAARETVGQYFRHVAEMVKGGITLQFAWEQAFEKMPDGEAGEILARLRLGGDRERLVGALLAALLRRTGGEMALLLALAVCGAAVMLLAQPLEELKGFWEEAASSWGQLPVQLFVPLVKTVGIALLCRTGSDLCRDAGESAIGSVLETAGAVAAIVVSLPLFRSAWELLRSLV